MIYLLALIVFALPSYLIRFKIFGIPTTLLEILIYFGVLVQVLGFRKKDLENLFKKPLRSTLHALYLFLFAAFISIFISPDKYQALGQFKAFFLDPVFLFFLIYLNVKTKEDISKILGALIFSGIFVSLFSFYQFFTHQVDEQGRVIGLFGYSPNYLALYLGPIIVLLFAYCLQLIVNKKFLWLSVCCLLLVVSSFALYLSGSRGGYLAIASGVLALGYFLLLTKFSQFKKWISIGFLVVLLSGFFALWQISKPDFSISPSEGKRIVSSQNLRWEIWKVSIKEILPQKWLKGVGLSNFQNYFTNLTKERVNFPEFIAPYALTPHNLFLTIWLNLGLLGLISFLWLLYLFFKKGILLLKTKDPFLAIILMAAMIAIIFHGLVDTSYFKNDLSCLFWILMGLLK